MFAYGVSAATNIELETPGGQADFGAGGLNADNGYVSATGYSFGGIGSSVYAGTDVTLEATGAGSGFSIAAGITADTGGITVTADYGDITGFDPAATLSAYGNITLSGYDLGASGAINLSALISSQYGDVTLNTANVGNVSVGDINAYGLALGANVYDFSADDITLTGGALSLSVDGSFFLGGDLTTPASVTLGAGYDITLNAVQSASPLNGNLSLTAGDEITLNEAISATGNIVLDAEGGDVFAAYGLSSTGGYVSASANTFVVFNGSVSGAYGITLTSQYGEIDALALTSTYGDIALDGYTIRLDGNVSGENVDVHAYGSTSGIGFIAVNGDITATAGTLTVTTVDGSIEGFGGSAYTLSGYGGVTFDANGSGGDIHFTTTLASANGSITLSASDFIQVSDLNAGGGVFMDAEGGIASADTTGGATFHQVFAYGDISLSDDTGTLVLQTQGADSVFGSVTLNAGGGISSTSGLNAYGDVLLTAYGDIGLNDVTAGNLLSLDAENGTLNFTSGAYVQADTLTADAVAIAGDNFMVAMATDFFLNATGGTITLSNGDILAGNEARLDAVGDIHLLSTDVTASRLGLYAGGDIYLDPLELRSAYDMTISAFGSVTGDAVALYAGTTLEIDADSYVQFDTSGLYAGGLAVDAYSMIDLSSSYISAGYLGAPGFGNSQFLLTDPDIPFTPISSTPIAFFSAQAVSLGTLHLDGDHLAIATHTLTLNPATLDVPADILVQLTAFDDTTTIHITNTSVPPLMRTAGHLYLSAADHFSKFPGTTFVFGHDTFTGDILVEGGPITGGNADFLFYTGSNGAISGLEAIATTGTVVILDLIATTTPDEISKIINEVNNEIVDETTDLAASTEQVEDAGPENSDETLAEDDEKDEDETAAAEDEAATEDESFEGQTDSETNSAVEKECTA